MEKVTSKSLSRKLVRNGAKEKTESRLNETALIREGILLERNGIGYGFWPCQRPLTEKWGSGQVFERVEATFGRISVAFGKTDGIPKSVKFIDKSNKYDWLKLPFKNNYFEFGYWDPPYDRLYKHEGIEIWRTCRKLAILHTHVWPRAWLKNSRRVGMVAVTMGPLKRIRCLQVFEKMI